MINGRIYKLICRDTGNPVYIGSTVNSLTDRYWQHLASSKKGSMPLYQYMRKNKKALKIQLIEEVSVESVSELLEIENKWIQETEKKYPLLNYKLGNSHLMVTRGVKMTDYHWELRDEMAKQLGISKTQLIQLAVREMCIEMGIPVPQEKSNRNYPILQ